MIGSRRRTGIVRGMFGAIGMLMLIASAFRILAPTMAEKFDIRALPVDSPRWILCGTAFSLMWLCFTPGYKRLAFVLNTLLGIGAVLAVVTPVQNLPLVHDGLFLLYGIISFLLARFASRRTVLAHHQIIGAQAVLLVITLTTAAIRPQQNPIAAAGKFETILNELNPLYRQNEELQQQVDDYVRRLSRQDVQREARRREIEELNRKIERMSAAVARFERVAEENRRYKDEIAQLSKRIGELEIDKTAATRIARVRNYQAAIRPTSPRVREFAVRLAAAHPGSFYRASSTDPVPSREGLRQVLAIHTYSSGRWKYVNDPLFENEEYFSPADRTIALGLAGDCDDFAILMASCIEAVGGKARIMHGRCAEGAHAWCELYVGTAREEAASEVTGRFPGRRIDFPTARYADDYWLCLDWQVGVYSCGESARVAYTSGQ